MPSIESACTRRPIIRERSLQSSGPSLTLKDVRMPRRGNVDDLRSDEPNVLDSFQRAELKAMKELKKLHAFAASRPVPSLRPRLVRIASAVASVSTITNADEPDTRIEPARASRQARAIYNRHGLTSRGRIVRTEEAPSEERAIPGATIYPALPAQSTRFYAVRAKS